MNLAKVPKPTSWEIREIGMRLLLAPFVLAPRPLEFAAARTLARYLLRPGGSVRRGRLRKLPPALSDRTGIDAIEYLTDVETLVMRERIRLMRGIVFPWWRRKLSVSGLSEVRAGLEAGRGVILWVHQCVESNVAVKQAMFMAGHPLAHLSRPGHPFSGRPFGVRFVNPILRRPEVRFLAERVVIDNEHTIAPIRRLRKLLIENRVVSITVVDHAARVNDFDFLGGTLRLAAGPVELAAATQARLLPVFTSEKNGRAHVEIGSPLPITGSRPEAIRETHLAALRWLEERIMARPEAWIGWRGRSFRTPPPASL